MRSTRLNLLRLFALAGCAALCRSRSVAGPFGFISQSEMLTAVNSRQFNGYVRARQADGSCRPETFAFGDGDVLPVPIVPGLLVADPTMDKVGFRGIATMLAVPLAGQNYVRASDPAATDLLIMVYWGRTIGTTRVLGGDAQDAINFFNASLLGFDEEAHYLGENPGNSIIGRITRNVHAATLSAVSMDRYYVILRAFDFQAAWRRRTRRLLWESRFSLSERAHDFERDLPNMARSASVYFGQDSYGLVRTPLLPEGHVHIGELKSIEDNPGADEGTSPKALSRLSGTWASATPGFRALLRIDGAGHVTFEDSGRNEALPARVSLKDGTLSVTVPGWDVLYLGRVLGGRIYGTISQYGRRSTLVLARED